MGFTLGRHLVKPLPLDCKLTGCFLHPNSRNCVTAIRAGMRIRDAENYSSAKAWSRPLY